MWLDRLGWCPDQDVQTRADGAISTEQREGSQQARGLQVVQVRGTQNKRDRQVLASCRSNCFSVVLFSLSFWMFVGWRMPELTRAWPGFFRYS